MTHFKFLHIKKLSAFSIENILIFDIPVTGDILTIDVKNLDTSPTRRIHWDDFRADADKKAREDFVCRRSEEGFEIDHHKESLNHIPRLSYLNLTGISSSFKPKIKCQPRNTTSSNFEEKIYYYLGQTKRLWKLQTKHALRRPMFFLVLYTDTTTGEKQWRLAATGKYYPCLKPIFFLHNAVVASTNQGTKIDLIAFILFKPSWIHQYMSNTGESDDANKAIVAIEAVADLPSDKSEYTILVNEKNDSTKSVALVENRSTIGWIPVVSSFEIRDVYWSGNIAADTNWWRNLVEYGFSGFSKHFALSKDMVYYKGPIMKAVESISKVSGNNTRVSNFEFFCFDSV